MRYALLVTAMIVASPAAAQNSVCAKASLGLENRTGQEALDFVAANCKTGDLIYIKSGSQFAVSSLCDFTKTIYVAAANAICVVKLPPRTMR